MRDLRLAVTDCGSGSVVSVQTVKLQLLSSHGYEVDPVRYDDDCDEYPDNIQLSPAIQVQPDAGLAERQHDGSVDNEHDHKGEDKGGNRVHQEPVEQPQPGYQAERAREPARWARDARDLMKQTRWQRYPVERNEPRAESHEQPY